MQVTGETAAKQIAGAAEVHDVGRYGEVVKAPDSPFGTESYCATVNDGKGILCCHASGKHAGQVFYVRKGIGWFYVKKVGSTSSILGLPVTNEYETSHDNRRTDFEGGSIEWIANEDKVKLTAEWPL